MPIAISHLSYADDLLVFLAAIWRNLQRFKQFLTLYEGVSGQAVNWHNNSVAFFSRVMPSQRQILFDILGMRSTSLPMKYLGSYLHTGITRTQYCTIQHVDSRLSSW